MLCYGQVARMAAIFLIRLCKATLEGLRNQLRQDGVVLECVFGMHKIDQTKTTKTATPTTPTTTVNDDEYAEVGGHVLKFVSGEPPFT